MTREKSQSVAATQPAADLERLRDLMSRLHAPPEDSGVLFQAKSDPHRHCCCSHSRPDGSGHPSGKRLTRFADELRGDFSGSLVTADEFGGVT